MIVFLFGCAGQLSRRGWVGVALMCLMQAVAIGQEPGTFMMTPDLMWWDTAAIDTARQRVAAGDASLRPAAEHLRREAEEALRQQPVTVTSKAAPAPSGSKHDYVSLATYWWPDPSKPDGLPYVRRDGQRNPEIDDPQHADRSKLATVEHTVETLAWAYLFFGEERYAKHAAAMLRTFFLDEQTRMNPHLRYAQAIPGHNDGRFIGLIDTARLARVLDAATILQASPAWDEKDHAGLRAWFGEYLDWLTTHEFGRLEAAHPNNHGTWFDVQVASYARYLGRDDLQRKALERARDRIGKHFKEDGSQPHELDRTRSFNYSVMNLWGFMLLARMGEDAGVNLWHHEDNRLQAGIDYLVSHAVDKDWPHEQIIPIDQSLLLPLLHEAARAYGSERYGPAIKRLEADHPANRSHLLYSAVLVTDRADGD